MQTGMQKCDLLVQFCLVLALPQMQVRRLLLMATF